MHFTETRMQPASYFEISPNYIKHQLHYTRARTYICSRTLFVQTCTESNDLSFTCFWWTSDLYHFPKHVFIYSTLIGAEHLHTMQGQQNITYYMYTVYRTVLIWTQICFFNIPCNYVWVSNMTWQIEFRNKSYQVYTGPIYMYLIMQQWDSLL